MKKLLSFFLLLCLCMPLLAACGDGNSDGDPTSQPSATPSATTSDTDPTSTSATPAASEPAPTPPTPTSEGLVYTKTADGTAYAVSDYAGDGVSVLVPDTYGGLPVTAIESGAFAGARQITAVRLPASVTAIGSSAFTGCKALAEINLPEGVVSIGNYAFAGCESLTSLTLPTTLSLIGCYAFDRCTSLTEITFPADGAWYRTYDPAAETGKETDVSDPEDNAELLRDDWHTYYLKRNTAAEDTVTGA